MEQSFCFQIKFKYFLDNLIQKLFFQIIQFISFRGELTDNSAKKEALLWRCPHPPLLPINVFVLAETLVRDLENIAFVI